MSAIRAVVVIASMALIVDPAFADMPGSMSAMQWHKRVVLAASPVAGDANLAAQRDILEAWRSEVEARDVAFVAVEAIMSLECPTQRPPCVSAISSRAPDFESY